MAVASQAPGATAALVAGVLDMGATPLPPVVRAHAKRILLNVLATTIGASRHPSVEILVGLAREQGGDGVAPIPGRCERLDPYYAAMVTGLASHIDDFDDTHLQTVIHPGGPALAALFGLGSEGVTGRRALRAFAIGCEVELRVGLAVSPWHYDAGWHITGTCGVIGAAVVAGLVLGLEPEALTHAIGIAASETLGLRVAHGTMVKAAHPGKAAANGILAAMLAERGFTAAPDALGGPRGFFDVLSPRADPDRLLTDLGTSWHMLEDTMKPYPGGVVTHPFIDAALAARGRIGDRGIAGVTARCHRLVLELTSDPSPSDGLHARLSTPHAVAVALTDGTVGLGQYADRRVADPAIARLREKVALRRDDTLRADEGVLELVLDDGERIVEHVTHARGSLERPLEDRELLAKVQALVEPVLPGCTEALYAEVEKVDRVPGLAGLIGVVTPSGRPR
jgi:2-methylcitrate dehydratase PrpD